MKTYQKIQGVTARRLKSEQKRIERKLRSKKISSALYCQLYAAQQALAWVIDPSVAASPCKIILSGKIQPIAGTLEG